MVLQVVATGGSNSVELVIRQRMAELSASGFEGIGVPETIVIRDRDKDD